MDQALIDKAKKIKLLILDVDGVMTDGKVHYGNYGDELKTFSIKDGFGTVLLGRAGIKIAIITAKKSKIARLRARDLGIKYVYEDHYKIKVFTKLLRKFRITREEACFIGDDLVDIPILNAVGLPVSVPQGVAEAKDAACYITKAEGGSGAVREICELILKSQSKWAEVTGKYFT